MSDTGLPYLITRIFDWKETGQIFQDVQRLRGHWDSHPAAPSLKMLPAGLYATPNADYLAKAQDANKLLHSQFGSLYERILDAVSEVVPSPEYDPELNLPGFHIVEGKVNQQFLNYHQDAFKIDSLKGKRIQSFVIPIKLPSSNKCGLRYITERNNEQVMEYREGNLYTWPGHLQHSFDRFTLDANEWRITWQFHGAIQSDKTVIFW